MTSLWRWRRQEETSSVGEIKTDKQKSFYKRLRSEEGKQTEWKQRERKSSQEKYILRHLNTLEKLVIDDVSPVSFSVDWMSELTEASCSFHVMIQLPVDLTLHLNLTQERKTEIQLTFLQRELWILDLEVLIFILSVSPDYKPKTVVVWWGKHRLQRVARLMSPKMTSLLVLDANYKNTNRMCDGGQPWQSPAENTEPVNQLKHSKK